MTVPLLVACVAVPAFVARYRERSWLAPGIFFSVFWTSLLALSLLIAPDYTLVPIGVAWIALSVLVLGVGAVVGTSRRGSLSGALRTELGPTRDPEQERERCARLVKWAVVFAGLGLLEPVILARNVGTSLPALFSVSRLAQVAHFYTNSRYASTDFREPGTAIFASSFIFVSAIVGGILVALRPSRRSVIAGLACFVPAIASTLILTTRAVFVLTISFWLAAYLAMALSASRGRFSLLSVRTLGKVAVVGLAVVAIMVTGFIVRGGIQGITPAASQSDTTSGLLGSPSAFTLWFDQQSGTILTSAKPGTRTLAGPLGLILPVKRAEFPPLTVGSSAAHKDVTTIRTLFGDLINDYSAVGSLVVLLLLGYFSGIAFARARRGGTSAALGLAMFYTIVLTSAGGVPFSYTTVAFAWAIAIYVVRRTLGPRTPIRLVADPVTGRSEMSPLSVR